MHVGNFSILNATAREKGGYLLFRRIFSFFEVRSLGTPQRPANGELFLHTFTVKLSLTCPSYGRIMSNTWQLVPAWVGENMVTVRSALVLEPLLQSGSLLSFSFSHRLSSADAIGFSLASSFLCSLVCGSYSRNKGLIINLFEVVHQNTR